MKKNIKFNLKMLLNRFTSYNSKYFFWKYFEITKFVFFFV